MVNADSLTEESKSRLAQNGDRGLFLRGYHEISHPDKDTTVIDSMKSHLTQLEELHARLHFMMGEVKGLLKK